jgi:membrane-bound serine protease (ClpP class)
MSAMTILTIAFIIISGFIMLAIEVLLIPGFSIPGLAGIALIIYGIFRAHKAYDTEGALITILLSGIGAFLLVKLMSRSRAAQAISLQYSQKGFSAPDDHSELAGKEGVALSTLRPAGVALIEGNRVDVVTDGEFIEKESPIRVLGVEGTRVIVTRKEKGTT